MNIKKFPLYIFFFCSFFFLLTYVAITSCLDEISLIIFEPKKPVAPITAILIKKVLLIFF